MDKNSKKQVAKISVFITSIFVIFLSVTYALINMTLVGTKRQVITAGNLEIELEEENAITLSNAMPMYDEVGMLQDSFHFSLKNTGTASVQYIVNLVDVTDSSKDKLDTSIVKYGLTKDGVATTNLLSTLTDNQIDYGTISGNQTIEYGLRLWIDSKVTDNNQISEKSLSYRIDVEAEQETVRGEPGGTFKVFEYDVIADSHPRCIENFCHYRISIESIIFENKIDIPTSIAEDKKWDLSEEQNGSVMAYIEELESDPDLYKLHFQGENGIYANSDCTAMFAGLSSVKSIEGLEYFNTSKATNMLAMFFDCSGLTSLDLSYFDTSNVTNMISMFSGCSSLTSLDVGSLDTPKVTNMSGMFEGCSSLTRLDLSSLDTSNLTSISSMFYDCKSLISLDLSSFTSSKLTGDFGTVFWHVKTDCLIIVKDEAMKAWILERNSSLTNVVVKSA